MLVKLMKEIANELFAKEEGLQYIIFFLAETYKLYLQGNIILSKEIEEYLREYKIPVMYELNINKKPHGKFKGAGIIAIEENGEIRCCAMEL